MGNTTSIASNILVFPVPKNTHVPRRSRTNPSSPISQSPHGLESSRYTARTKRRREHVSFPLLHRPAGPRYVPARAQATQPRPRIAATVPIHPRLTAHHIQPRGTAPLHALLRALCISLRDPTNRALRPRIAHIDSDDADWVPTTVFHLTGDFETAFSSAVCSVLLTRESVVVDARGEDNVLGQHYFVHVFEAGHLAQSFGEMLGEWEGKGWVSAVDCGGEDGVEEVLEACALGAVGSWVEGSGGDGGEGWIGVKMMERAEEVVWGMWLGVNVELEAWKEMQGDKWWVLSKLISSLRIY